MKTKLRLLQFLFVLAWSVPSATNADVAITLDLTPLSQPNCNDVVSVSFTVYATSDADPSVLTVAGGYSLSCQGGQNNPRPGNTLKTFSNPGGNEKWVTVAGNHTIAGYDNWEDGSQHSCTADYKGGAAEGATGISGSGFNFVFQVGSLEQGILTDDNTFNMTKCGDGTPGGGGCQVEQ